MSYLTPEEAASLLCPLARTFAPKEAVAGCRGQDCAFWRWQPLSAGDPRFVKAIQTISAELGGGANRGKEAWAILMKDPARYGAPDKPETGYCGAAGDHKK